MDRQDRAPRLSADRRAAIQAGEGGVRALARLHGVNPKTIQRWRRRGSIEDRPAGRPPGRPGVLSPEEVTILLNFRSSTRLALDDCLYALQPVIPHLRRSTLHRCLRRHGLSDLGALDPRPEGEAPPGSAAELGHIGILIGLGPTQMGMTYMFGATDRRTRSVFATVLERANATEAAAFLGELAAAMPFAINTVFTDAAEPFMGEAGPAHPFARACSALGVRHVATARQTQPAPDAERLTAALSRFKYHDPEDLRARLAEFLAAVNLERRLKSLGGRTPRQALIALWRAEPDRFTRAPV